MEAMEEPKVSAEVEEFADVPEDVDDGETGIELLTPESRCTGAEADIISHLLFHKSIIKEPDEKTVDLDNYVQILRELDNGMHLVLNNPVDRAVAIAFQLVKDEKLDPWNIDLVEFTKLYLKKIRKESDINFVIAGRIVMMAWNILKTQSDEILIRADHVDEPQDFYFDGWDMNAFVDESQTGLSYGQMVLQSDSPPLTAAVHATDTRAVTLMSLIEAFDEAREEMELKERIKKLAKNLDLVQPNLSGQMHKENLQDDISLTWQRICAVNEPWMPITKLWNGGDVYDRVTVFVSTLFLAKMQKIELKQQKFPYGEIMIKNIEGLGPSLAEVQAQTETPAPPAESAPQQPAETQGSSIIETVPAGDLAVV